MLSNAFLVPPPGTVLDPWLTYKVTRYSQVDEYVLVGWVISSQRSPEEITGETLYMGAPPVVIASSGGALDLYDPSFTGEPIGQVAGVSQIPTSLNGLCPAAIGAQLKDPASQIVLAGDSN